ncbi:hypothetical protein PM082_011688 [Marasmius tenuissimus]|nr:hypothetical protein PM082_011688 [Marasmius tenuissimus]
MDSINNFGKKQRLQNACDECRKKKGVFSGSSPLTIDKAHVISFQFDVIVLLHHTAYAPGASRQVSIAPIIYKIRNAGPSQGYKWMQQGL